MAVALDRARLATGWILEKDRESRQLKQELRDLKQVIESQKMIYVSEVYRF